MSVYLCTKFQVSSVTLTSFRQMGRGGGGAGILPPPPPLNKIRINKSSILQLTNAISNNLQKLLKYISGTTIFTPFFVLLV